MILNNYKHTIKIKIYTNIIYMYYIINKIPYQILSNEINPFRKIYDVIYVLENLSKTHSITENSITLNYIDTTKYESCDIFNMYNRGNKSGNYSYSGEQDYKAIKYVITCQFSNIIEDLNNYSDSQIFNFREELIFNWL